MPRTYRKVNDVLRFELIRLVKEDFVSIKFAATSLGVHYENAKAIFRVHRTKNRIAKLKTRTRTVSKLGRPSKNNELKIKKKDAEQLSTDVNHDSSRPDGLVEEVRLESEHEEAADLKVKIVEHISEVEEDIPEFSSSNATLSINDRHECECEERPYITHNTIVTSALSIKDAGPLTYPCPKATVPEYGFSLFQADTYRMPSRLVYENDESSSFRMASKIFLKMNLGRCRAFPDN
jgi:hypothetical protein